MPFYRLFIFNIKLVSVLCDSWKIFPVGILDFVSSYFKIPWFGKHALQLWTHCNDVFISAAGPDLRCARNSPKRKIDAVWDICAEVTSGSLRDLCSLPQIGLCSFKCFVNQRNRVWALSFFRALLFLWKIIWMLCTKKKKVIARVLNWLWQL